MKGKNMRLYKRIASIVLALFMVVGLVPMMPMEAKAAVENACTTTQDCTGTYVNGFCSECDGYEAAQPVSENHHPELLETHNGYYAIENAGQFYWFAAQAEATNYLDVVLTDNIIVNDVDLAYDKESKELTITDKNGTLVDGATLRSWTPIGRAHSSSGAYSKTLDGNGYYISGLYYNVGDSKDGDNGGIFGTAGASTGYSMPCTIKNLGLLNSYFGGDNNIEFVGSFIGRVYYAKIENCYSNAIVNGSASGGLVGGQSTSSCYLSITDSYYFGTLIGSIIHSNDKYYSGAIASSKNGYPSINNCYYLDSSFSIGNNGATAVSAEEMSSGKLAYLLGEAWGQNIDNDEANQGYPVVGGARVYKGYDSCFEDRNVIYTNDSSRNETLPHKYKYSVSGDVITEICEEDCGHSTSLKLIAPAEELCYDGTMKEAELEGALSGVQAPEIVYTVVEGAGLTEGKPINAGKYVASITIEDADSIPYTVSVDFEIEKVTPTVENFVFTAPADLIYSAEDKAAAVVVRDGITGVGEITIKYYKNGVEAIPNQVGSYTVQILVAEGENYKSAELSSDNWAFDISYLSTPEEATLSGIVGSNGWYVGNVNLAAPDQFTISVDGDTYSETITYDSDMDESITYYLKDSQGYIALKNITIKKDTTLPTVLYRIGSDEWKQFVNAITFGIFCKDYTTVEIKATDAMSGVQKIEYYVANQEMSDLELEAATWDVYNGALDLDVAGKYIIYVRVTDMAGNVTEDSFATEGIVIYKDSTVTSTASREYKAGTGLNITYSSNGNTLDPVLYHNDQPLNMGLDADYAFAANAEVVTFTRAFLDSLGAGTHEITFVFHPQGVETTAVTIEKTLTLTVTPAPLTIESATVTGREYNGTKDVAVTGLTISGIKDTDSVGVSFDNLTGTLTSANAGTYTSVIFGDLSDVVTLTGDDASNYELVYASGTAVATNVTIAEGPHIENEEGKMGWDAILDEVEDVLTSEEENTLVVDMNGQSIVPVDVLEEIKGKDIEVKFDLGDGIVWTVKGADITGTTLEDIDFAVTVNTEENPNQNIPVSVINKVTGEKSHVEISLAHDGEFGFTAVLTLNLDAENAGLFANLYYYNPTKQAMEFICADEIAADGTTDLTFTHASDYTIVIDDEPANQGNVQPPQTGDHADITLWAMLLMAGLGLVAFGQKKHVR